jgi:Xaa-Pro aminopeptidase
VVAAWPKDEAKWQRLRSLLAERELDAVVARAPDNVLYLTNYWPIKGYDVAVFPREGEPFLAALDVQRETVERNSWTQNVRYFPGYHPSDPRPPFARALDLALDEVGARGYGSVGLELSQGTQIADRFVGEPTTYTRAFFDAFPNAEDAAPLLAEARALKTDQELERIRLANELAAEAMAHVQQRLRPGMKGSEAGAIWESYVHGEGCGYRGKVEYARGFSLVWSGPAIKTFTASSDAPVKADEPTLFEIWVCVDGYWCDHTKNLCPGDLSPRYDELLDLLLSIYAAAIDHCEAGASLAELDRLVRRLTDEGGYGGQPSHPICHGVGARAHEPPFAHQAADAPMRERMVLAVEPGIYWEGGGGLRLEDNFLITADGAQKLCPWPDDFRGL